MAVQPSPELRRGEHHDQPLNAANMGQTDRSLSYIVGGALIAAGVARRGFSGVILALLGGSVIAQGASGFSPIIKALGANRAVSTNEKAVAVPHQQGTGVDKTVTINAPRETVFAFWRNFENLPRFMSHLESVTVQSDGLHSHWVAKAPVGQTVEWDAEIINEIENEVIGWRSVEGAMIANAGAVRFNDAPEGRGTEVQVKLQYMPPAGALGAAVANLLGEEPNKQIEDSLQQLKQLLETQSATTEQPANTP